MSIKDKITSLLFSAKPADEPEEKALPKEDAAPEAAAPEAVPVILRNPALLELTPEHPIQQLYHQRRGEGGYLPAPRVCLDEAGELPEELVLREKSRLQTTLTSACSARLKKIRGKSGGKQKKDKDKNRDKEKGGSAAEEKAPALDALPFFFVSNDKLLAWMLVFPPVGTGAELSRNMLRRALAGEGILYGVDEELIDRLPHAEERYFTLFLVARGKEAFDGKNGNIVDYFPRTVERVLEVDEYGQVDYTDLNLTRNVKQGQEICRLIKPTEGEPGMTVLNQEIPAKSGKDVILPQGRNTEVGEDGVTLVASIAGHVEFTGRSFQVKPVLDIDGNVDFSTGNINFLGDINIRGDVLSGFTVRAMGSIQVGGVVEAGSSVEAGGDLVVVKGILGDGSTIVRSHRSIFSKYIENSTMYVRENLQTDCIVNSDIYCDGEVQVRSGRGSIMGGRVWAARLVSAQTIGSRSECRTVIALGGLPCTNFERELVQLELRDLELELEKLECQLDSPAKASLLSKLRLKLSTAELKLKQLEDDLMDIKIELQERDSGRLECGIAFPGTEVSFGDETLRLRQEQRQCVAKLVNGEILLM